MDSNIEWRKWGEKDPLYAVATWPGKERHGPNAWTDEQFYRLGESDWADFAHHWKHYGMLQDHCVEIGCGAGRITKQLSTAFRKVTALDISPHQLDYAKSRITAENVAFVLTAGLTVPLENASCSAAFSTHVFQHFDSHREADAIFREIHRVLQAEGTMMVHLPAYHLPDMPVSAAFRPVISLIKRIGDFRANINRRLLLRGKWRFVMRRLRFERPTLSAGLRRIGFTKIEFRFFPVSSNNDYHEFVLATKSAH